MICSGNLFIESTFQTLTAFVELVAGVTDVDVSEGSVGLVSLAIIREMRSSRFVSSSICAVTRGMRRSRRLTAITKGNTVRAMVRESLDFGSSTGCGMQ